MVSMKSNGLMLEDFEFCTLGSGTADSSFFDSLVSRVRSALGAEFSGELVTLSLEEPERFFTENEIDSLFEESKMVPLGTQDVPHWDIMFFSTKRIGRPNR